MHPATEAIGILASLTSFLIGLPHAARIWTYRDDPAELRGIALGSQWIGLAGTVLWSTYAVLTAQVWVGAPHLVNGPITVATIVVLLRARRSAAGPVPEREGAGELSLADLDLLLEPVLLRLAGTPVEDPERELVAA